MEGQAAPLSQLTTLRIGGVPRTLIDADTESDFIDVVADHDHAVGILKERRAIPSVLEGGKQWYRLPEESEESQNQLLVLGGGSNLVVSDAPYLGTVIRDSRRDFAVHDRSERSGITVEATSGTTWDDLVAYAIGQHWSGLEALSGIPGTVGAAPVQNIGAYGREIGENLAYVRAYDRLTGRVQLLSRASLDLAYRSSILKKSLSNRKAGGGRTWQHTGRWVVLSVALQLLEDDRSAPIRYTELANALGVEVGSRASTVDVRAAVLELRSSKGMVLDPEDHDTWSAGSFFTNPILTEREADEKLPFKAPRFPVEVGSNAPLTGVDESHATVEGKIKTSAAWLIQQAGFSKGFGLTENAQARLSTKHVLALTNRGDATSEDVVELARAVRDGVESHFGIRLEPEPVQVGISI